MCKYISKITHQTKSNPSYNPNQDINPNQKLNPGKITNHNLNPSCNSNQNQNLKDEVTLGLALTLEKVPNPRRSLLNPDFVANLCRTRMEHKLPRIPKLAITMIMIPLVLYRSITSQSKS